MFWSHVLWMLVHHHFIFFFNLKFSSVSSQNLLPLWSFYKKDQSLQRRRKESDELPLYGHQIAVVLFLLTNRFIGDFLKDLGSTMNQTFWVSSWERCKRLCLVIGSYLVGDVDNSQEPRKIADWQRDFPGWKTTYDLYNGAALVLAQSTCLLSALFLLYKSLAQYIRGVVHPHPLKDLWKKVVSHKLVIGLACDQAFLYRD